MAVEHVVGNWEGSVAPRLDQLEEETGRVGAVAVEEIGGLAGSDHQVYLVLMSMWGREAPEGGREDHLQSLSEQRADLVVHQER